MKLLYANKNTNLSKPIVNQLKSAGFEVDILIEDLPPTIDKSSLIHRISNIFYRVILKDKTYFLKKEKQIFEKFVEKRLKNKKYDIAFFIRADMYSEKLISKVRQQTKKMVSYQWDGLEMYPKIFDLYKYFDRRLVFDRNDMIKFPQYNLLPISNFHYILPGVCNLNREKTDLFYVGVGLPERIFLVKLVEKYSKENNLQFRAILTVEDYRKEDITDSISLQHNGINLELNDAYISLSNAVIDFKLETHNGASFRIFECLRKEKKLVSNNHDLKNYDFYHPDNIFITDFADLTGLKEFLQKPYHKIDRKLVEKYGVENWLKYALDYGNYEVINLP